MSLFVLVACLFLSFVVVLGGDGGSGGGLGVCFWFGVLLLLLGGWSQVYGGCIIRIRLQKGQPIWRNTFIHKNKK